MEQTYGRHNEYRHAAILKVITAAALIIVLLTATEGNAQRPETHVQPTPTSESKRTPRRSKPPALPTATSEATRAPRRSKPPALPTATSEATRAPRTTRPSAQPTPTSEIIRTPTPGKNANPTATVAQGNHASDIFPQGAWTYTGNGGQDWMNIFLVQMPSDEAMKLLEEYNPIELAIEEGINYIGENPNSWYKCREFAYGDALSPIFVALCVNDDMTLFVLGTDEFEVSWVAFRFSEGDPGMIPPGYYLQP